MNTILIDLTKPQLESLAAIHAENLKWGAFITDHSADEAREQELLLAFEGDPSAERLNEFASFMVLRNARAKIIANTGEWKTIRFDENQSNKVRAVLTEPIEKGIVALRSTLRLSEEEDSKEARNWGVKETPSPKTTAISNRIKSAERALSDLGGQHRVCPENMARRLGHELPSPEQRGVIKTRPEVETATV